MKTSDATTSGRDDRDFTRDRLLGVAQWVALAGGVVAFLAVTLTGAVISSAHAWPAVLEHVRGYTSWGTVTILVAALIGAVLATLVYVTARFLPTSPGIGLVVFAAVAAALGSLDGLLLTSPGSVVGSHAGTAEGPSDLQVAGMGLLLAAGLLALAASLTAVFRRRAATCAD